MHVFIIAALTADGYIGRDSHHFTDWTGQEDIKQFVALTKEAGVVIMGSRTLKTIQAAGKRLPGRRLVVYTTRPNSVSGERVETTAASPAELLQQLDSEGVTSVAIIGGTAIYSLFMSANLVDELYLSIVPIFFGSGVRLFDNELQTNLDLISTKLLADKTVQLHYRVNK
jgi:dihydrofolate reductase